MRRTATAASWPKFRKSYVGSTDPNIAHSESIPAPTWGWDALNAIANMGPDHAIQLDNFIPRTGYCEIRRGSAVWSGLMANSAIESLMVYNGVSGSKMFAASKPYIYDVSTPAVGTILSNVAGPFTIARWQHINMSTPAGHYLICANGTDTPQTYNGSAWADLAVTGFTITTIQQLQVHQNRLWMIPKNSTKVWYLDVQSIAGAANGLELGSYMSEGGTIIAAGTWTVDTRQTVNDYITFITSNGTQAQAIVFAGTDPADSLSWALYGVYSIAPPIGTRCFFRAGADLAIITIDGIIPMSSLLTTDRSADNTATLTKNIYNEFLFSARNYSGNFGWECCLYPRGQLGIVNVPYLTTAGAYQYVYNTLTGAWCRFTGIDANCFAVFNDIPYFGSNRGVICQFDTGASDSGTPITATMRTAFNYFGDRSHTKRYTLIRPQITTNQGVTVIPGIGINTDFSNNANVTTPNTVSWP